MPKEKLDYYKEVMSEQVYKFILDTLKENDIYRLSTEDIIALCREKLYLQPKVIESILTHLHKTYESDADGVTIKFNLDRLNKETKRA